MRKGIRIGLLMIFATLSIGLLTASTATGQQTASAVIFPAIPVAQSCEDQLKVASQRLDKALDAYEKAMNLVGAKDAEIASRKALDDLKNQWIAVKDAIIKAQADLIDFYQKQRKGNSVWGRIKSILEVAEKVALIAMGILVGRGF